MPNPTFNKIQTIEVGAGGSASIDFASIPSTYTDLCLKGSFRTASLDDIYLKFNTSTSNQTVRAINGNGSSASSTTSVTYGISQTATANTFVSWECYIPNYTLANNKSFSIDNVSENNGTTAYSGLFAGLWSQTAAITGLTIYGSSSNIVQYSSVTLYGIKNS